MAILPYDEMCFPDGRVRPHYRAFADCRERTPPERIAHKRDEAERAFHRVGVTFAEYGEDGGTERLIPFFRDPISSDRDFRSGRMRRLE